MQRACFPPQARSDTDRLCSAGVRVPSRSPASSLVCGPPTPPFPSAWAVVPLAFGLSLRGLILVLRFRRPSLCGHRAPGDWSPAPRCSAGFWFEREGGSPRLLGRPLRARPRPIHPAGCWFSSPYRSPAVAFRAFDPLGTRELVCLEADSTWLTRSCVYVSLLPSPGKAAQDSLPGRLLGATRAGVRTRRAADRISEAHRMAPSLQTSLSWSHRKRHGARVRLPAFRLPAFRLPAFRLPAFRLPAFRLPAFRWFGGRAGGKPPSTTASTSSAFAQPEPVAPALYVRR
jgi:hypothetical protein